jgi:hypothetical protein
MGKILGNRCSGGIKMKFRAIDLMNEFKKGKRPKQLIRKRGLFGKKGMASKNTVYKYYHRFLLYKELEKKLWRIVCETL